jgi:hypothetical protein
MEGALMAFGIYTNAAFSNSSGIAAAALAEVEVRREDTGALASIFADRDGVTPLDNPFLADANGRFEFYAAGLPDGYEVTVTDAEANSHTLNYQAIGTAQYQDVDDLIRGPIVTGVAGTNAISGTIPATNEDYIDDGIYLLTPAATNTGAVTLALTPEGGGALDAKDVYYNGAACVAGELVASVPALLQYDGTRFNIIGPVSNRKLQGGEMLAVGSVAGTANAITGSLAPAPSSYTTGLTVSIKPTATNTGATTINLNGLGAKNVFARGAACVGGELRINVPVTLFYDGTQFQVIGPDTSGFFVGSFTRDLSLASGSVAYTGVGFKPRAIIFIGAIAAVVGGATWGAFDGTNNQAIRAQTTAGQFSLANNSAFEIIISGGNLQTATVSALGDDGFTLAYTKTGTPTGTATIKYIALR